MRYALRGKGTVAGLTMGGGLLAGAIGVARGVARRSLGPMALPLAIGTGMLWLGRSLGEAFVDLQPEWLHVKFGALFDEVLPLSAIESVESSTWSLLGGLGVRSNLKDLVAVTTQAGPVAKITFRVPQSLPIIPMLWHVSARQLVLSPDDLDGFVAELRQRLSTGEPAD